MDCARSVVDEKEVSFPEAYSYRNLICPVRIYRCICSLLLCPDAHIWERDDNGPAREPSEVRSADHDLENSSNIRSLETWIFGRHGLLRRIVGLRSGTLALRSFFSSSKRQQTKWCNFEGER